MKITYNFIKFSGSENSYKIGHHKITEYFDDSRVLTKTIEHDEFDRIVDTKWFNQQGEITEQLHKDYYELPNEKGFIEHYKSKTQEYTRKACTKFIDGAKHTIDEFISKTSPERSYINEFIYDLQNKLKDVITKKIH